MSRALVGTLSCGRCGFAEVEGSHCARCAAERRPASPADVALGPPGPFVGVVRARRWRWVAAAAIDVIPVLALLGLGVATARGAIPHVIAAWVPVVLAVVLAGLLLARFCSTGRGLGGLLLGLRTVDDLTALPVGLAGLVRRHVGVVLGRTVLTADLRAGQDPAGVRLVPVVLGRADDPALALTPDTGVGPAATVRPSVGILLETGERYEIHDALIIGRSPVDAAGRGRPVLSWPDMSRRLAKSHVLLEWSGTVLWVTDLGTSTGTSLGAPDAAQVPLSPAVRAAAYVGSVIECGGRRIKVVSSG